MAVKTRFLTWFESVRVPVTIAVGLRLGLSLLAFLAYILYPQAADRPFPSPTPEISDVSVVTDRLINVWSNWDGSWYLLIAQHGYQADPDSRAFFPVYPMLVRGLGILLFGNYRLAGVILSTFLAVVLMVVFYETVRRDFDRLMAERAVFYLSIFPTVFYLFAIYTESAFMALILGSFFSARHLRKWWLAGILGALAALTRNLGVFIVFPLFVEWTLHRYSILKAGGGPQKKLFEISTMRNLYDSTIFSLALPMVALAGWLVYSQLIFGDALGSVTAHSGWSRGFEFPLNTIVEALRPIFTPHPAGLITIKIDWYQGNNLLDLGFFSLGVFVFLYGCWKTWRRQFPPSYLLYFALGIFIPLLAPVKFAPLLSFPRFLLPLFPLFILWAQACRTRNWLHFLTLYLWLASLGLLFLLFANGYWVA